MTLTKAREIMRDENRFYNRNFKYIHTYKVIKEIDDCEIVLFSPKTGKQVVVCDREDIGGFTGAHFLKITYWWCKYKAKPFPASHTNYSKGETLWFY